MDTTQDQPVKEALDRINAKINAAKAGLDDCERQAKLFTDEIEKYSTIANKLVEPVRIEQQTNRAIVAASIPKEERQSRMPKGEWEHLTLAVLTDGPLVIDELYVRLLQRSGSTEDALDSAFERMIAKGIIVQDGNDVYSKEWMESKPCDLNVKS